jgi:hypothetical protein
MLATDLTRKKRRYCAADHFRHAGMTIPAISTTVWKGLTIDTYEAIDRAIDLAQWQSSSAISRHLDSNGDHLNHSGL